MFNSLFCLLIKDDNFASHGKVSAQPAFLYCTFVWREIGRTFNFLACLISYLSITQHFLSTVSFAAATSPYFHPRNSFLTIFCLIC